MLISQEYHPYIYNLLLKQFCSFSVVYSPFFLLPLEHYLLHLLLITVIITLPPSSSRKYILFPISGLHLFKSPLCFVPLNSDPLTKLAHSFVISQLFNVTFNLLCSEEYVELTDYRLKYAKSDSNNMNEYDIDRFKHLSLDKFKWSFQRCFTNMRGVGWNFQMRSVVSRPSKTVNKWKFIVSKCFFLEIVLKFLLYDFALLILNLLRLENNTFSNQYISTLHSIITYSPIIRLLSKHLASVLVIYYGLNSLYWITAIFSLTLDLSNTEDWPEMFNFGSNGFSMSKFWSFWWHQYITRDAYLISKRFVDLLKLNKDSYFRRYLIILLTFLVCGYLHAYASISLDWNINIFNPNVPSFVPQDSIFNKCFYSLFLFVYSAHIVFLEVIVDKVLFYRLSFLNNSNLKFLWAIVGCMWMILIQAWPVVMYVEELEMGGLYFPLYHYPFTLSALIN